MNYQVNISPVTGNKPAVLKLPLRFLGSDQKDKVENLIKNGGMGVQNANHRAAINSCWRKRLAFAQSHYVQKCTKQH